MVVLCLYAPTQECGLSLKYWYHADFVETYMLVLNERFIEYS